MKLKLVVLLTFLAVLAVPSFSATHVHAQVLTYQPFIFVPPPPPPPPIYIPPAPIYIPLPAPIYIPPQPLIEGGETAEFLRNLWLSGELTAEEYQALRAISDEDGVDVTVVDDIVIEPIGSDTPESIPEPDTPQPTEECPESSSDCRTLGEWIRHCAQRVKDNCLGYNRRLGFGVELLNEAFIVFANRQQLSQLRHERYVRRSLRYRAIDLLRQRETRQRTEAEATAGFIEAYDMGISTAEALIFARSETLVAEVERLIGELPEVKALNTHAAGPGELIAEIETLIGKLSRDQRRALELRGAGLSPTEVYRQLEREGTLRPLAALSTVRGWFKRRSGGWALKLGLPGMAMGLVGMIAILLRRRRRRVHEAVNQVLDSLR